IEREAFAAESAHAVAAAAVEAALDGDAGGFVADAVDGAQAAADSKDARGKEVKGDVAFGGERGADVVEIAADDVVAGFLDGETGEKSAARVEDVVAVIQRNGLFEEFEQEFRAEILSEAGGAQVEKTFVDVGVVEVGDAVGKIEEQVAEEGPVHTEA